MYTNCRLRYATRWNRRAAFAIAIALLLFFSWRAYRAWQLAYPAKPKRLGWLV